MSLYLIYCDVSQAMVYMAYMFSMCTYYTI